jgi:hypothetical protein
VSAWEISLGRQAEPVLSSRRFVTRPIAGLAIALGSGEEALPELVTDADIFTIQRRRLERVAGRTSRRPRVRSALHRAVAGVIASRLPGFELTPAIAGMAAAFTSVLELPLSSVVLATLLVSKAGAGAEPLIIVAVVVSYIVTLRIGARPGVATT